MAQKIINHGEGGLSVRSKLNSMFGELYAAIILPLKLSAINTNTEQMILGDSYLQAIYVTATNGNPTIRIGTSPNGEEILPDTIPGPFSQVNIETYFSVNTTLYITVSDGTLNMRFGIINDFY